MSVKVRRDSKGRPLKKGESERKSEHRYRYAYTDIAGSRHYIYNKDLNELRKMESRIARDFEDGIGIYGTGNETVNDMFDRYLDNKYNLRGSTKVKYVYLYDHYVRDNFGKKRIKNIVYSDVVQYYIYLIEKRNLALATVDNIHCLLHPAFQMAVRDQEIRLNPTDDVMAEIRKLKDDDEEKRHPLSEEEQKAFLTYIRKSPLFSHWWPMFTILLGTGCRIGEAIGLRWADIDFDEGYISVNHSVSYYKDQKTGVCSFHINKPKTEAGIRTIPMYSFVRTALEILDDVNEEYGPVKQEIDGYSGFIFRNRYGDVPNAQSVNRAIERITAGYNAEETLKAAREHRDPVLLPHFTCHHLRHTFITRLCERETNLKVIMAIAGHHDIKTTMERYAEATERRNQQTITSTDDDMKDLFGC